MRLSEIKKKSLQKVNQKNKLSFLLYKQLQLIIFFLLFTFSFTQTLNQIDNGSTSDKKGKITQQTEFLFKQQVDFTSSNLPIVVINTNGQTILNDPRIVVDMGIIYNGEGVRNNITGSFNNYDGKIAIEIRGSSSQYFYPKKQYALETQDSEGNNLNVSLLGLPEENDWILYAPYSDKTLMRNVLVYKFSNEMGRYASRTKYCELVINGDYLGIYVLMEKIKRDKNRVDISTINPDDIEGDDLTGGYIIKIDKEAGENNDGWLSPFPPYIGAWQDIYYQYHYPKPDNIVPQQETYIQNFIYNFESTMFSSNYDNPIEGYPSIIDINSFVDYFIINEVSKNVDGYRLSAFMYKDKDSENGKLFMGPVWDFNLAFGNADYYDGWKTYGWQLDYLTENSDFLYNDGFQVPFWWEKLMQDSSFVNKINCRWQELKDNIFNINNIFSYLDSLVNYLDESQERNYERWPDVLGHYVWPNPNGWQNRTTYASEINWMKQWIYNRISWIDINIPGECLNDIDPSEGDIIGEFSLKQNYPNPFNQSTLISYKLNNDMNLTLKTFDLQGNEIRTLLKKYQTSGHYSISWDGRNNNGKLMNSGIYIYRLSGDRRTQSRKMLFLK